MFKMLYQELVIRLEEEVGRLKYIDQDLGQLDHYEVGKRPPVQFPCLLIDFTDASFEDFGSNVQLASVTISLRLGFTPYTSANNLQTGGFAKKALQFYDIEADIQRALHGYTLSDGDFRELARLSASTEKRLDSIRVRNLVYTIEFEDDSTKEVKATKKATMYFKNIPPN